MTDKSKLFLYHDLLNLGHDVSIASIGKIKKSELQALKTIDPEFSTVGWPTRIEEKDIAISTQYNFNNDACVEQEDFVMFGSVLDQSASIFLDIISNHFNFEDHFENDNFDLAGFSSYFAHLHEDAGVADWRAQINFILDNEAKHSILSIDGNGKHHLITPKSGEIIFLDVHCKHAIIPNQKLGIDVMRQNPMVSLFVS